MLSKKRARLAAVRMHAHEGMGMLRGALDAWRMTQCKKCGAVLATEIDRSHPDLGLFQLQRLGLLLQGEF